MAVSRTRTPSPRGTRGEEGLVLTLGRVTEEMVSLPHYGRRGRKSAGTAGPDHRYP